MTNYKGYEITKSGRRRFVITLNNKNIKFITGSLQSVHFYIDSNLKYMTPQPVDVYEGLELSEDVPTSEEINAALGVKEVCSFTEAVEANVAETKDFIPVKERQLTEEEKHFYWEAYHEGYKQGQAELNDIVNP
jgi:hypothetical protein